jgi:hypothetical protein
MMIYNDFFFPQVLQHALESNILKCIGPEVREAAVGAQIEDIKRCIRIALLCVKKDPEIRPTMREVAGWLRNKNQVLPSIYRPGCITKDTIIEPKTVQGGSTVRNSKKSRVRKPSKH